MSFWRRIWRKDGSGDRDRQGQYQWRRCWSREAKLKRTTLASAVPRTRQDNVLLLSCPEAQKLCFQGADHSAAPRGPSRLGDRKISSACSDPFRTWPPARPGATTCPPQTPEVAPLAARTGARNS